MRAEYRPGLNIHAFLFKQSQTARPSHGKLIAVICEADNTIFRKTRYAKVETAGQMLMSMAVGQSGAAEYLGWRKAKRSVLSQKASSISYRWFEHSKSNTHVNSHHGLVSSSKATDFG